MVVSTKDKILELLEKNRGKSVSGEELAAVLGVSRTAVWKAVKSLVRDGYEITAVTNRGYSLSYDSNIISVQGMLTYLKNRQAAENIFIFKSLESTNKTAKEMAVNGCSHGTIIIADTQTSGRGRQGKSFFSPPGSGLYMSIVLRPQQISLSSATLITAIAAVAVCRAIKTVTGKETTIKWVNDILLDGKKICGILTEAVTDFESGGVEWIVVGVGINVSTCDFPCGIRHIAGALYPGKTEAAVRNRLAAGIIDALLSEGLWQNTEETYAEYKSKLSVWPDDMPVIEGHQ